MKKKYVFSILSAVIIIFALWLFFKPAEKSDIIIKPTRGLFKVTVTSTGELEAKNSIEIQGPANTQAAGIWQMKISKLVPEGSVVKTGDFVAELDKSEVMTKVKEVELNIQKLESQYLQARLDSTLNLSNSRDELENLKFAKEEKKLLKEQSIYEPPAAIRQAEIDYQRAERGYDQALKNYTTKVRQAIAKLSEVGTDLSKEQQKLGIIMNTLNQFTIKAPADGMVIYVREWNGKRRTVGSTIGPWNPTVAKLPDLISMESITYINEVDIRKIKVDQFVSIGLDAVQNKKLKGKVISIANIGEQKPNTDSKVFEVRIRVNDVDTTLRPSMTTSNEILVETQPNALFVPLECVHTENNISFVYKKAGSKTIKQQVKLGLMNENEVVILKGLTDNDEILMTVPQDAKELK